LVWKLTFEVGLVSDDSVFFHNGSFFGSGFLDRSFLSGSLFTLAVALTVALALAVTLAFTVALTLATAVAATAAAIQQVLSPGNDLLAVGGDDIHGTGNSGQSNQDLGDGIDNFHEYYLHFLV
jgi:hypothetical protein